MTVLIMAQTRCPDIFTATWRPQREATEHTSTVLFNTAEKTLRLCRSKNFSFFIFLFSIEEDKDFGTVPVLFLTSYL